MNCFLVTKFLFELKEKTETTPNLVKYRYKRAEMREIERAKEVWIDDEMKMEFVR